MRPGPGPAAQPFYLDTRGGTVLCWWHATAREALSHPVLMCPTWGDEEIGAYGGWRALAHGLAQQGVPVLRLDLPGEGDSLERPGGVSAWAAWLDALEDVALALRQVCSAAHIHLMGLRLGALLAAQLADRLRGAGDSVASLILLAPVASGRSFLREGRLLGSAPKDEPQAAGEVTMGGFVLDALSAQDLAAAQWPDGARLADSLPCPVFALERSDRPLTPLATSALSSWAGSRGLVLEQRDDLVDITAVAHSAIWPDLTAPLCGWLLRWGHSGQGAQQWPVTGSASRAVGSAWTEELVHYGPGMWALCTRPLSQPRSANLFLSSGAERRIGPHRLWVRFARERAAQGEVCLRLDLAGLGDSADRRGSGAGLVARADVVYDPACVQDVEAALQWVERAYGLSQVRLVGLCSGAHHAWRCAVAGLRLSHVVAINPVVFYWRSGMSLDPTHHAFGQIDIAHGAVRSLKDPVQWLKLLRGNVQFKVIFQAVLARLVGRVRSTVRHARRWLRQPLTEDMVTDLRQVICHETPLTFVFSEGDPGEILLREHLGSYFGEMFAHADVHLTTIARADHTFTTRSARDTLYNCLHRILSSQSELSVREVQNLVPPTSPQS